MTTNEKICKWLKLHEVNSKEDLYYFNVLDDYPVKVDFLHDRNQQGWIIDELKRRGYRILFCIDEEESNCTIYGEEDDYGDREILHYYANKDLDLAFIQAVEQLIDKENREEVE